MWPSDGENEMDQSGESAAPLKAGDRIGPYHLNAKAILDAKCIAKYQRLMANQIHFLRPRANQ